MEKKSLRVRDMTQGSPIRLILGFAIPLFIDLTQMAVEVLR